VVVGFYEDTSKYYDGLIETLASGSWTPLDAPEPSNAGTDALGTQQGALNALACTSTSTCTAAGTYGNVAKANEGLLDTLASGSWASAEAPEPSAQPSDPYVRIEAMSCPSSSSCVAAGTYVDGDDEQWGVLETMSSGSVQTARAPAPSGAGTDGTATQRALLDAVSCWAVGSCIAVGTYVNSAGDQVGLIETLAGALACASDGGCEVGASYLDSGPTTEGVLDSVLPPAPSVSGVSPSSGSTAGGTSVTVSGSWFFPGASATFESVPGSVTYQSATGLEVTSPAGSGAVDIQVSTAGGTSPAVVADQFDYLPGSPGTLSLAAPPELYWAIDLDGYDQWASASASPLSGCAPGSGGIATSCAGGSEPVLEVADDTGSGDGWAIEGCFAGASGLPAGSVLDFDGSGSAVGSSTNSPLASFPFAAATPGTVCDDGSNCALANPPSSCSHGGSGPGSCPADPVQLAGSAQVELYAAAAGAGEGDLCLATGAATAPGCTGTSPSACFDLGLPASARGDSYATATVTLTLASGP
jgi:hypothetical protein